MSDATSESWFPVAGYMGFYEMSSLGRMRSLPRNTTSGKVLKATPDKDGYLSVHLCVGGVRTHGRVHQLACETFHGPRPEGLVVRHLDGNNQNNTPGNLKWGTDAENAQDRVRHGTDAEASKTHCPQGHPYEGDNLVLEVHENGRVSRKCRECLRLRARARYVPRPKTPKTRCPYGHLLEGDNLVVTARGWRVCRTCQRESGRRSDAKRRS